MYIADASTLCNLTICIIFVKCYIHVAFPHRLFAFCHFFYAEYLQYHLSWWECKHRRVLI